jgi:NADH-quinone oxidoreductase subunit L
MGGLAKLMPVTYGCFLVGSLALVGIFPLAGFFSKDSILAAAMDRGWYGYLLWAGGLAGAFLTGVYTFRMVFVVFGGEPSAFVRENLFKHGHGSHDHAHGLAGNGPGDEPAALYDRGREQGEGPWTMLVPVAVLAVYSVIGGWIQWAPLWEGVSNWLDPVAHPLTSPSDTMEAVSSILGLALGLAGIAVAWLVYARRRVQAPSAPLVLEKKFFFDELYDALFYWPAVGLAKLSDLVVERGLIGGSVTGVAGTTRALGTETRGLQTGLVRTYVLMLAAGVAVLIVVFVAVR